MHSGLAKSFWEISKMFSYCFGWESARVGIVIGVVYHIVYLSV